MDATCETHTAGRQAMIFAFSELTTAAGRAGVNEDLIHELHRRFFDGNVETKRAFWVAVFLARVRNGSM